VQLRAPSRKIVTPTAVIVAKKIERICKILVKRGCRSTTVCHEFVAELAEKSLNAGIFAW
jgi:hypothetical protein